LEEDLKKKGVWGYAKKQRKMVSLKIKSLHEHAFSALFFPHECRKIPETLARALILSNKETYKVTPKINDVKKRPIAAVGAYRWRATILRDSCSG
jgi:hypothetical protein